jgi:hypothetical protein
MNRRSALRSTLFLMYRYVILKYERIYSNYQEIQEIQEVWKSN